MGLFPILLLILILIGIGLMPRVVKGRRVREPSCGSCGYPVAGLIRLRCPECGADLADAGIYTRAMRRPIGRVGLITLWTVVVGVGGWLLTWLAISEVPGMLRQHESIQLTSRSGAFAQIDVRLDGSSHEPIAAPRRATLQLSDGTRQLGPTLNVDMTTLIAQSPWHDGGAGAGRRKEFSDREILAWMAVAGADPTHPIIRKEARVLYHRLVHRAAVWRGGHGIQGSGGSGPFASEVAITETSAPAAWLAVGVWLIVWAIGLGWIVRLTAMAARPGDGRQ